ncbi:MAG: hypothetical protein COT81_00245 [Candidatus Buchananbacteria bacterium CG10_big_fil_rev_8_21_14_0_10_42_9]|uniref:Rod shape-determining protein RodA n=1 Tax=Candidatus Buchananbacteria bacterium CG10_big_fil_rev_8_21_14_0_10_42_9 TaxID=1974526 RepID=A0A2H0W2K1_9BACT|nr:MAG: hypothetical protein COT81_00245 [Candidatus Buchananbacteria bacterium CG10_big_fil_rev_8_21_14_0_10_42_9]
MTKEKMLRKIFWQLRFLDWYLLGSIFILLTLSGVSIFSVALSQPQTHMVFFQKQLIFIALGVLAMLVTVFIGFDWVEQYSMYLYAAAVILLLGVLFFGVTRGGTTGWYDIFGLTFQPVEIAKLILVFWLAHLITRGMNKYSNLQLIALSGAGAFILFLLVALQPDFGSAVIIFLLWWILWLIVGMGRWHFLVVLACLVVGGALVWTFALNDIQRQRVFTFANPTVDVYGAGYNVRQAKIAIGAGGLLGRGVGFGTQTQLKFLPAAQTDFIFAVIAEELGLLGTGLVVLCFGVIFLRLYIIATKTNNDYYSLVVFGILIIFFSQFFINIGMNLGLLPVTGIPLPFVSAGGSFLIVSLVFIGLAESVFIRSVKYKI